MRHDKCFEINFSISAAAGAEIENIQKFYDSNSPDKADVLAIAWETTTLHDGRSHSGVVVGYYRQSERRAVSHAIQVLDGRELIFFVNEKHSQIFRDKVLDFSENLSFYLRQMSDLVFIFVCALNLIGHIND